MELARTQLRRILELERKIRDGEYPNCITFAEYAEVSQKTVQRDIDYLRDQLEAPIEYDRIRKGYYYTTPNWFLPSLVVNEADIFSFVTALRSLEQYRGSPASKAFDSVFHRIQELLPDKVTIGQGSTFDRISFTAPPSKPVDEKIWNTVIECLLQQRSLKMTYRSFHAKTAKPYVINPYHVANLQGEWYVFGTDGDDDVRQYAMPRIQSAELTNSTFDIPKSFDPKKLLSGAFGRFAAGNQIYKVKLMFDADVADWVTERQWHETQKLKKKRDGRIELSFEVAGLYEVERWVLSWGSSVKVLGPKELVQAVSREVELMSQRYEGNHG